jgi:hypothetical protein
MATMKRVASIRNERHGPVSFWLEPWAEQFEIQAGSTLELHYDCADDDALSPEVQMTERLLVYWFGSGCRVRVFMDGVDVTSPCSWTLAVP